VRTLFEYICLSIKGKIIIFIFIQSLSFNAHAKQCELKSASETLNLIKKSHPDFVLKKSELGLYEAGIGKASQVPNPQINFTSNHGERGGVNSSETTGSIQYVFELGGKKSSRVGVAKSQYKLGEAKLNIKSDYTLIDAALKIARFTQINTMLALYRESLDVFKKMRSTLRKNRKLSPEQQIQEDMVDMEVSKHRIIISKLTSEFSYLEKILKFYVGQECKLSLVDNGFSFPKPDTIGLASGKTPEFEELEWQSKLNTQKLSLAQSKSYPNLKIGPSMQLERGMGQDVDRFGISLTLDLPVLNRNKGGKNLAKLDEALTKSLLSYMRTENDIKIQSLFDTYKTTFETLTLVPKKSELLKKHHKIERFFLRGLISIPTMIDGHDELLSLIEERDEHELLALKTYLKINQAKNDLESALDVWSKK